MFPSFEVYVKFVQGTARGQKDPSFQFTDVKNAGDCTPHQSAFTVRKTGVNDTFLVEETPHCLIYNDSAHHWQIVIKEKITVLREKYIGFRCLQLNHRIKNCKHDVSCDICGKANVTDRYINVSLYKWSLLCDLFVVIFVLMFLYWYLSYCTSVVVVHEERTPCPGEN